MSIEADLRRWSREVLEVPSKHLNGFPPCPHARKAWLDDQVLVVETDYIYAETLGICDVFRDLNKKVVVVASYAIPDIDAFNSFVEGLNEAYPELHCMQFHPEFGAEDAELDFLTDNDWESDIEAPYCMIFIQNLADVVESSDRLEELGYYKGYPDDEYEELVVKRKKRLTGASDDPD